MKEQKHLITPSGKIHIEETGKGFPMLLVHGLFASGTTFNELTNRTIEGVRLINIDLPDHGDSVSSDNFEASWESFAKSVIEVADALKLSSFNLAGHSMGGGIAAIVAALNPDRVNKLILIDAVTFPFSVPLKGRLPLIPVLGELLFKLYPRKMFMNYFEKDVFADSKRMNSDNVSRLYESFDRNRSAALKALRATANPGPVTEQIPYIKAPTLALWGEKDTLIETWVGEKLALINKNILFKVILGSGHSPIEEYPEETCKEIFDFISPQTTN